MPATSRALGCLALCAGLLSSASVLGQGESKKNCGPGRRPGINGCVDAAPRARSNTEAAKAPTNPKPPTPAQGMRLPPEERTATQTAEHTLFLQELARLENLLKLTPKDAPERAALLKRLAETYAELAKRAEHDREVARIRAERAAAEEKAKPPPRRPRARTTL